MRYAAKMRRACLFWAVFVMLSGLTHLTPSAGELPIFQDDTAADTWLRQTSATYRKMAATMEARGGYSIALTTEYPESMTISKRDRPVILLNEKQKGATRLTLLIFEFANASQWEKFREIAASGTTDSTEYAILHMLIEYESLLLHHQVLADLDQALGGVPKEMFQRFRPDASTFATYEIPPAYDYVKLRKGSTYRRHYEDWFREHVEKKTDK